MFEPIVKGLYAYIEKSVKEKKEVLFDFVDSNGCTEFLSLLDGLFPGKSFVDNSMVLVHGYNRKRVREMVTYKINNDLIISLAINGRIALYEEQSYIIGYTIDMNGIEDELFLGSKSFNWEERFFLNADLPDQKNELSLHFGVSLNVDEVIVRNIGQGNWNELYGDGHLKLIYDLGTRYKATKKEIESYLSSRKKIISTDNPILVLSHWDVDHYQCIFGLTNLEISNFGLAIFRNHLPTLTSRKAYALLVNTKTKAISPEQLSSSCREDMRLISNSKNVSLFNSAKNKNRNKEGLAILVNGNSTSVVLPADIHYTQVSFGLSHWLKSCKQNTIVVPHHGGNAGKYELKLAPNSVPKEAIISVGKNSYGHPSLSNIKKLMKTGYSIVRTDSVGMDYTIKL